MSYGYSYTFPALRGIQGGREYYVAMCPMKLLPRIFLFDESQVPPELRAQRTLNTARVPEIARYLVENPQDYAFSAITASIDGEVQFVPADTDEDTSDAGRLIVPMSARFVINDGQHRRAAIKRALEKRPELGNETIAVVFFLDAELRRSQQLFADLNKHAVRPTKSLGILYDYRDPLACLSRDLVEQIAYFRDLTELEKSSISNRSIKLFTLSGIYQATCALLGKKKNNPVSDQEKVLATRFWKELGKVMNEWSMAAKREVNSSELRSDHVHAHSVLLHALGLAGNSLIQEFPDDWANHLQALGQIDWRRSNTAVWEGRAMIGGQMSKARQNVQLTANYLKSAMGLSLTPKETELEEKYLSNESSEVNSIDTDSSKTEEMRE